MSKKSDGRFKPGVSGNPSGKRKDAAPRASETGPSVADPYVPVKVQGGELLPQVRMSRARADDWQNPRTGQGIYGADKRVGAMFNIHSLSFDQLKDLWLGDDLAARAVETIPKEAMRQGYDVIISDATDDGDPAELAAAVKDKLEVLGADEYLEVAGDYERGYGGGAILIGANDGQADLTKPLDLNKVKSLDWLTPLEAREIMPLYGYTDPRAPKYGQPEIYQLNSRSVLPSHSGAYAATTQQVHESRMIIFPGIRVSRYQQTTARGGWGESILSRVWRVLRDFNTAWSSAGVLVSDFAQAVIKVAGLWESLSQDQGKAFQNRLNAMDQGRSTINAITIDAGDSYERQQTPMSGLPELLVQFANRLAAACDMPLTLLFGTSPSGLNATGESDVRFFYDRVAAYQRRKMEPALRRLCQIIFRTMESRREPAKWSVKFRPLWQESAKEQAAAMFSQAQADNLWVTMGALSADEVANSHWGKGEYDPQLTVDFAAREAQESAAAAPVSAADLAALDPNHYTYVPPPEPGTVTTPADVPSPAEPAAPDPNTKPVNIIGREDRAARAKRRRDSAEVGDAVLEQLADDFPPESLAWVAQAFWQGPVTVSLDQLDFANADSWEASKEPEKVEKFAKRIRGGWVKPLVLIKRPTEPKLMIADGHHRALAYRQLGRPAVAYVAHVPSDQGPWDELHDSQHESERVGEDQEK